MSLQAAIDQGVDAAFQAVDSLLTELSAVSILDDPPYDPVAGEYAESERTDPGVRGVKFDFELQEIDGQVVLQGDAKFLIKSNDLSYGHYNYFTVGSRQWDVVGEEEFPSDVVRLFHVRLSSG